MTDGRDGMNRLMSGLKIQETDPVLKRFIVYGMIYELMSNFYKPFAVKFLERIGGGEWAMSLFNSLPGLITLFAVIPGAIFIRKQSSLKIVTMFLIGAGRSFLLLMAFIPFLSGEWQVTAFLLLYSLMCFPDAIYQTSYQAFVGKIFREKDRAYALSTRNKLTVPLVTVMTLFIGKVITSLPRTDHERILIYQAFFLTAFVFGLLELYVFKSFKVEKENLEDRINFIESLKKVVHNKPFIFFTACSLAFHFGWQMGWPLFNIYTIKTLGADEMWLAIISVSSSVTMFFAYGYWNRVIHKKGNAYVLAINTMGMAITPLMYILSFNLYVLTFTAFVSGIFIAGTTTVLLSGLLEVTPEADRVTYLAIYSTLTNLSLAIAPLIGHWFLGFRGIAFALVMTAIFRIFGSLAFFYRNKKIGMSQT